MHGVQSGSEVLCCDVEDIEVEDVEDVEKARIELKFMTGIGLRLSRDLSATASRAFKRADEVAYARLNLLFTTMIS